MTDAEEELKKLLGSSRTERYVLEQVPATKRWVIERFVYKGDDNWHMYEVCSFPEDAWSIAESVRKGLNSQWNFGYVVDYGIKALNDAESEVDRKTGKKRA